MLEPIILYELRYVLPCYLRELRELAQQPAETHENVSDDDTSLTGIEFRHRKREVSIPHSPQPAVQMVGGPCDQFARDDRTFARQGPEQL